MKDLNYYLNLPWEIRLRKIPKEDGGGWMAYISELGKNRCLGDGRTPQDAVRNVRRIMKKVIAEYLEEGIEIKEPEEI